MKNFWICIVATLVLSLPVAAQTAQPATPPAPAPIVKPAAAPTITDAQKAAYWKALAQQQGAQKQLDTANAAMNTAVQQMIVTCGADASIQAPNGDPVCVLKPEEKKPAEKK